MTYFTKMTRKGQITIPKEIRKILGIKTGNFAVELSPKKTHLQVKLIENFLELARKIKIKKIIDPVKTRELMEKSYERK